MSWSFQKKMLVLISVGLTPVSFFVCVFFFFFSLNTLKLLTSVKYPGIA